METEVLEMQKVVTQEMVFEAQEKWGNGVVKIGSLKDNFKACEFFTNDFLDNIYSFEKGVLFKPTKTSDEQFRPTKEGAISYFIGGNNNFEEDNGFAVNPWTKVRFENKSILLKNEHAVAMGNYFFTDLDGDETKVEFTFGYCLEDGELKVELHHSSLPYNPE